MRIVIDRAACEGNALCMGEAPEVFEVDDEDTLHLLTDEPADELAGAVERAAAACPKAAIELLRPVAP